jgi:hypothetical protein
VASVNRQEGQRLSGGLRVPPARAEDRAKAMSNGANRIERSAAAPTKGVNKEPAEPAAPNEVPMPKRGAFPTPKSEIDSATPYVAEIDETNDHRGTTAAPPTEE